MNVQSTYKVELEDPTGNAVLTFRKPKMNAQLAEEKRIGTIENPLDKIEASFKWRMSHLVSVENFVYDGEPVTVETLQKQDVDFDTMTAIVLACNAATKDKSPEKKD